MLEFKLSLTDNYKIIKYLLTSDRLNDLDIQTIIKNDNVSTRLWSLTYILKDDLAKYLSNAMNINNNSSNQLFQKCITLYDHKTKVEIIGDAITQNLYKSMINNFIAITDIFNKLNIDAKKKYKEIMHLLNQMNPLIKN